MVGLGHFALSSLNLPLHKMREPAPLHGLQVSEDSAHCCSTVSPNSHLNATATLPERAGQDTQGLMAERGSLGQGGPWG